MKIRPETPADIPAIHALTEAAFAGLAYADGTEADIIDALRAAGALTLSLVTVQSSEILGHVAFSPAQVAGQGGWLTLGPVSVAPAHQRQGLGSALIRTGLARLQERGARGVILMGNPAYYTRFGFAVRPELTLKGQPSPYLQGLAFDGDPPAGNVAFHPAFGEG